MKKYMRVTMLILILFGLTSCAYNNETKINEQKSTEIDMKIVNKILGEWTRETDVNYPGDDRINITLENNQIVFENDSLQIINTKDNMVQTQTPEEKPFYYDFKVIGDELIVYPSYPVPKGSVGGDLAPMKFIR